MEDDGHSIPIVLDYRVAYTVIRAIKLWVNKLEQMLDKAVVKSGMKIPCKRTGKEDRRCQASQNH